ncbi:MAG: hypothetical protein IJN64_13370 [Lachnospiraceae bacterium]|nr:hypothetical protein [Lachnospiraceae bacterium]
MGVALFDSGAQKTVVSESFLRRCNCDFLTETVNAGNNNGNVILLGYDVINMYKWIYNPTMHTLDISDSDMTIKENLVCYDGFPIINISSHGQSYNAGIDTGLTETILGKNVKCENCKPVYIEDDVVGIGTAEKMYVQMIPKFKVDFEGAEVELHNITMQDKIYGAPEGMDILLGMDFFDGIVRFKK